MGGLIGLIKSLLDGLNLRARWLAVGGIIILFLLAVYVSETATGWNYYRSLSARLTLLERLNALSVSGISENRDLYPIYTQLVRDLAARDTAPLKAPSFPTSVSFWKAMTGASPWMVLAILGLFGTFGKETSNRVVAVIFFAVLAVVFGYVGSLFLTIVKPWVNYVVVPAAQILALLVLSNASGKRKARSQAMSAQKAV